MMRVKIYNKIPRIIFQYKSKISENILGYREFAFPAKMSTLIKNIKFLINGVPLAALLDEKGILVSHDRVFNSKDKILAVGVGSGISLIHNCLKSRDQKFTGIEASYDQIQIAKKNAKLNNVDQSKFALINGFAESNIHVYGNSTQHSLINIDINSLNFDVLELDCEGAEIEILNTLSKRPKHIIVETHPTIIEIDYNLFNQNLLNMDYKLN